MITGRHTTLASAASAAHRDVALRRCVAAAHARSPAQQRRAAAAAAAAVASAAQPACHLRRQQQQQSSGRRRRRLSTANAAAAAGGGDTASTQVAVVGDLPAAARGPRAVVAVIDHTKASVRAVSWALTNIYREGDVLHLLHVVPAAAALANGLTQHAAEFDASDDDAGADLLERARAGIERVFVERCVAAGAAVEVAVVAAPRCGGDAACCDLILQRVAELRAAVVVMPEQRQTLFESLFFRPVSQQVAARCPAPTVLIR